MKTELLREYIIIPALKYIDLYSEAAVNLLLGTAAQETHMGDYIRQIGGGPALGIYQIEPNTHKDVFDNFLKYRQDFCEKTRTCSVGTSMDEALIGSLFYQTLIARLIYYRVPEALPEADDILGLAQYWKKYFNTYLGAGKVDEFVDNYKMYVGEK